MNMPSGADIKFPAFIGNSAYEPLTFSGMGTEGFSGSMRNMPGMDYGNPLVQSPGSGNGLGLNLGTAQLALNGLGTIGSLYAAFKQLGMAKEQFKYQKNVSDTNLGNSIKSYNTALADRARSRAFTEGRPQSEADAYVAKNSATRAPM
jgi:hypothetical protein